MKTKQILLSVIFGALLTVGDVSGQQRKQIRIVGSSTVYPFSSYVAEEFGETTDHRTPIVESTGSGGGHKLFYAGVGGRHPDITNSSRRMKLSELEKNGANGVEKIVEIKIGFDGIAICQNKDNEALSLTVEQLALAVAEKVPVDGKLVKNPYSKWNQIDPALPDRKIMVLGPPTTSGTRDAFHELVMHVGAENLGTYPKNAKGKVKYQNIRQDGVWVDSGENDNLIVQKLTKDPTAVGIFGYSFLEENSDRIEAARINEVLPNPESVSSGKYPVSRSLFFYVKMAHLGKVEGLEEFVDLFVSELMIGDEGILTTIGLIPLPEAERKRVRREWSDQVILTAFDLK
ncbi:MAG: PstS family phosphate ABC transporter substrate-binding protein [Verrucomicrobia bacterium]|nr:PstS family phosphate ABC transporter substrate-binding protein [Verrucomicrobiota bacterium]